jgi:hypothetical protein
VQVADDAARPRRAPTAQMVGVCDGCHTAGFATDRLDIADGMHATRRRVVHEAEDIIRALNFDGLIEPAESAPARPTTDAVGAIILAGAHALSEPVGTSSVCSSRCTSTIRSRPGTARIT